MPQKNCTHISSAKHARAVSAIPSLQQNGMIHETAVEKAQALAHQYASVYTRKTNAPLSVHATLEAAFHLRIISKDEVFHELQALNVQKFPGLKGIYPLVLKELLGIILALLFVCLIFL